MKILLPPNRQNSRKELELSSRQLLIIGANGSGKTRFTDYLVADLKERAFCLSALEALYGDSNRGNHREESIDRFYDDMVAKSAMFRVDSNIKAEKLVALLLHDEIVNLIKYKVQYSADNNAKLTPTRLDQVIKSWQKIFPGNKILVEEGKLLFQREGDDDLYMSKRLSDGEKTVLFYLGSVLYAPKNSIIFVDSPSMFLHSAVSNALWNEIENMRPDCAFVYTTHDLEFAVSRTDTSVVWVRDYDALANQWDYSILEENTGLPDGVYLSIIGARKPVLFIEGDSQHSIDSKLYPLIFPEFTVKPLGSCNKVIETVRTFNDQSSFHHLDSYGIVDRDRRDVKEVEYLRNKKILVPDVAEVENLLILENVVKAVAEYCGKNPEKVFYHVRKQILSLFKSQLKEQALQHTRHRVKRTVEYRIDKRFSRIGELEDHLADLVNEINPGGIYNQLCKEFNDYYAKGDYASVIRVFNEKTMLNYCGVAQLCGLNNPDGYLRQILNILKKDCPQAVKIRKAVTEAFCITKKEMLGKEGEKGKKC